MKGEHIIAFGLGLLAGWLVLPMVLSMFTKKTGG